MPDHTGRILLWSLLTVGAITNIVGQAHAQDRCCAHCGGLEGCRKVCRLVCEEKKITTTCWGCKREDFCVPGPSVLGERHCELVCDDSSDLKAPCVQPKKSVWNEWIPGGCAKVYTKTKLLKRTITKTVPSFKWVVEDLCPQCEANCEVPEIPAGLVVPPPPVSGAKIPEGKAK